MGLKKKELLAKLAINLGPALLRLLGKTYRVTILEPDYSKPGGRKQNLYFLAWQNGNSLTCS